MLFPVINTKISFWTVYRALMLINIDWLLFSILLEEKGFISIYAPVNEN